MEPAEHSGECWERGYRKHGWALLVHFSRVHSAVRLHLQASLLSEKFWDCDHGSVPFGESLGSRVSVGPTLRVQFWGSHGLLVNYVSIAPGV